MTDTGTMIAQERESARLAKLASFAILDTPEEHEFDTIVALAQRLLGCPIALVSLVDDHRQWFKAKCGLGASETPRDQAFCAHAMLVDDIMVVEDATRDPRFAANPLVTGELGIRFYAGVPLRPDAPGFDDDLPGIGTLCVIDTQPRRLTPQDAAILRQLAALVSALIRARASAATALRLSDEMRAYAATLDRKHRQLHQAERMAGIGSWRYDVATETLEWSDQVYAIHGLPVAGTPPLDAALAYYSEEEGERIGVMVARAATHGEPFDFEADLHTADGRVRRVRSMGEPQIVDGRSAAIFGVFQDITERHAREQSLRQSAQTDGLTGLPNRSCFEERLEEGFARARSAREPLALLLLDLDGFKAVNDTLGHDAGDEVLRIIAARLRGRDFANAFVARLGGDEFVMLVTRPRDCGRIETVVGTALAELRATVERDGERRGVTATVGAVLLDEAVQTTAELLRRADLALYEAKRDERGTGRLYGVPTVLRAGSRRATLAA